MAAPIGESKNEMKKFNKKLARLRQTLKDRENIICLDDATNIICVCNGGLDNNVSYEEIHALFTRYGQSCSVLMQPQKSYCFISYNTVGEATEAVNQLNGHKLLTSEQRKAEVVLYTLFVSKVADSVSPSASLPPGLILLEDYISHEYAETILASIDISQNQNTGQQADLKHRRVKHYGYEFKYSINNVDPDDPLMEGIPEVFLPLLEKLRGSGVIGHMPDQLTVNQYQPGQGIPPHVDTPSAFEDGLVSLSLGSQVLMEFRHPDGQHLSVLLPHRSVLVMTGESRYVWSHGITPRKSDIVPTPDRGLTLSPRGVRTSFTFRKITGVKPSQVDSLGPDTGDTCLPEDEISAASLERLHVHQVYEQIADHFSGTRHSPWPRIADFLRNQPPGSLLIDIGCGNGKYFGINKGLFELGSDMSSNLAGICGGRGHQVYVGDVLNIPLREGTFDVCLCIAVIHHMSTKERRRKAVSELLKVLRPGGQALIYVWAVEQERHKVKSKYLKGKGAQSQSSSESQMDDKKQNADTDENAPRETIPEKEPFHLTNNMLDNPSAHDESVLGEVKPSGGATAMKGNPQKLEVHINRTHFKHQDVLVPWQLKNKSDSSKQDGTSAQTFHRFYHVFHQGELEELCESVGRCKVANSYYDQGNWAVQLEKL